MTIEATLSEAAFLHVSTFHADRNATIEAIHR